jgi:hypothetical protein
LQINCNKIGRKNDIQLRDSFFQSRKTKGDYLIKGLIISGSGSPPDGPSLGLAPRGQPNWLAQHPDDVLYCGGQVKNRRILLFITFVCIIVRDFF